MSNNRKECTMRQVNAATELLDKRLGELRTQFLKQNEVDWEENRRWHEKNLSPRERRDRKLHRFLGAKKKKIEALIFKARMGFITPDQLSSEVEKFMGE